MDARNELNHILNPIAKEDDPEYIRALYKGINSSDSEFETAINLYIDYPLNWLTWSSTLVYYLNNAGDCIDIAGIDHYLGTWINQPYDHWDELDTLFTITDRYGKKAAVLEIGYTTWYNHSIGYPHTEEKRQFINTAFPAIREKASNHDLTFVTWYELLDEPHVLFAPEQHFGIMYANFTRKLRYNDLKQQFSEW